MRFEERDATFYLRRVKGLQWVEVVDIFCGDTNFFFFFLGKERETLT